MKGRVGEHYTQAPAEAKFHKRIGIFLRKQYDRTCRACEQFFLLRGDPADPADRIERAAHNSKRLFSPVLPCPQLFYRIGIQSAARQVYTADPFYCQDAAPREKFLRSPQGIVLFNGAAVLCRIENLRAAFWTAVRLSMIASVGNILVFMAAFRAHLKFVHYRPGSVVRQRINNGIPGAAVCAVNKGIPVSAVCFCIKLCLAFRAHGNIRGDQGGSFAVPAFQNGKLCKVRGGQIAFFRGEPFCLDYFHRRHRRREVLQICKKMFQIFRLSCQDAFQARRGVAHPSADAVLPGKAVQKRTETYSLNNSAYCKADIISAADGALLSCTCLRRIWAAFHNFAFRIFSAIKSASSESPSPVRLLTRKRGASGLTVS